MLPTIPLNIFSKLNSKDIQRPFLFGICGSGMAPLANILFGKNLPVSGYDKNSNSKTFQDLSSKGAKLYRTWDQIPVRDFDAFVLSSAFLKPGNKILEFCKLQNLPIFHRSEVLHSVVDVQNCISVAGSHGKTTTTAMTAQILMESGLRPTVYIGGETKLLGGIGGLYQDSEYAVYESDESDGTFLNHDATIKILTNVDDDHLDFYLSREKLFDAFRKYATPKEKGISILCIDDSNVVEIYRSLNAKQIYTYGKEELDNSENHLRYEFAKISKLCWKNQTYSFHFEFPGVHYLQNSCAAILAGIHLGLEIHQCIRILENYVGVSRRLESIGSWDSIEIFDDYGHHPTEIQFVVSGLRKKYPTKKILVLFQPHRYTRTKNLYKELAHSLTDASHVFLIPIYSAGEEAISGVTSSLILEELQRLQFPNCHLLSNDTLEFLEAMRSFRATPSILLTIGAGNVREWGEFLLNSID